MPPNAWVLVSCGDKGWVGFDPTNAVLAQADHIILAIGRDYSVVAPIDGIILTSGEQAQEVDLDAEAMPNRLMATGA